MCAAAAAAAAAAVGGAWRNTSVGVGVGGGSGRLEAGGASWRRRLCLANDKGFGSGSVDVATLGNMCLDIVLNVPFLPPLDAKQSYMRQLEACPPNENAWEAGGICNFTIAAARLGLRCVSIGHIGNERFGNFLSRVLEDEGVGLVGISERHDLTLSADDYDGSTLVCWVLVDPDHRHAFCSRFDFNKAPVFNRIDRLPCKAEALIRSSKVLHFNGFVFDELSPSVVLSAVDCAHESGSAVFFDPGPRGESLFQGTLEDQRTLERVLALSDVLLLTADEARTLTGIEDPYSSAKALLEKGKHTKWVIIKLGADGSLMATLEGCHHVPGFKVDVIDTVGCGDSFAAAAVVGYNSGMPATTTLALANAVGAATAMACGAGHNVATIPKIYKVLSKSELSGYGAQSISLSDVLRRDALRILDSLRHPNLCSRTET